VLLNGDALSRDREVQLGKQVAPGIRLGHPERRREANLLERGDRFGPAADQREPPQRLVLRPARRARGDQHPRADTGQQNQRVPVAGEECLAERERFALVGQRTSRMDGAWIGSPP
jgi:hypothetical protein